MSRIVFESGRPGAQVDPVRVDVACFVGLVKLVENASLPPATLAWLDLQGWRKGPSQRPLSDIVDVPVPVENYAAFTSLFDTGGSESSFGTDYLAAAVRAFFAQGGKRCYIVRMGDPVNPKDTADNKKEVLQRMLPSADRELDDQRGWHGVGHLAGLPEVSFLAVPDLPVLCASLPTGAAGKKPVTPSGPEQFEECSNTEVANTQPLEYSASAPRLTPGDYATWAASVRSILLFLSRNFREMQLVAAFPMPQETGIAASEENPATSLTQNIHDVIKAVMPEPKPGSQQTGLDIGISSAFLQLAYPWLKTTGSHVLLEELEPPDGAMTGLLARNALTRGTYASAVKVPLSEIYDVSTILPAQETRVSSSALSWGDNSIKPLVERISLFGPTPAGLALLSDVTTYPGESYRAGRIHRVVAVILRSARTLGEQIAFESNGPLLWIRVQSSLRQLMMRLWQVGAIDGATMQDAFSVRCDRSTMTENDLDNGRLVALVTFNAASTIELIRVTMALETSGASAPANAVLAEAI